MFVMFIGQIAVVEFSQKNKAAFKYRSSNLQLNPDLVTVSVDTLRNGTFEARMVHRDTSEKKWEDRFEEHVGSPMTSSSPLQSTHHLSSAGQARADARVVGTHSQSDSSLTDDAVMFQLHDLADRSRFVVEDNRSKGGSVWAVTDEVNAVVAGKLTGWGFKYKPGRGWWRAS